MNVFKISFFALKNNEHYVGTIPRHLTHENKTLETQS